MSECCEPKKDIVEEPVLNLARTVVAIIHPTKVKVSQALEDLPDSERSFLLAFCRQYYRRVLKPRNQAAAVRKVLFDNRIMSCMDEDVLAKQIVTAVNAAE